MLVGATLKKNSVIFRAWRKKRFSTGFLYGVPFRWAGGEYVADALPDHVVDDMMAHNCVQTHIIAPLMMAPAELPDPEEDEDGEPEEKVEPKKKPGPKPKTPAKGK